MGREEDRRRVLEIVKSYHLDYSRDICIEYISDILNECWYDFYIEDLVPNCWEWDHYYYLDYYDSNAEAVICIENYKYYYHYENEEEIVDFILDMNDKVDRYRNKFSFLKQEKWNGIE